MSQGRWFIQAAVRDRDAAALRRVSVEFFIGDEVQLYEFVRRHHDRYGVFPGHQEFREHGFMFTDEPSSQPVDYHLTRLRERFSYGVIRETIPSITNGMANQDVGSVTVAMREALARIGGASFVHGASALHDAIQQVIADCEYAREHPGLRGVTFGWGMLDSLTFGAMPGDLIVVAGRPGAGKTNVILSMARAAHAVRRRVLVVSMEMGKVQIARRWVGLSIGLNPNMVRAGQLSRWGWESLRGLHRQLARDEVPVYLESGETTRGVGAVEAMVMELRPDVLYIDAAYLLTPEGAKRGYVSKWEQVSEVIGQLKSLALRAQIPVFISVQFNRNQKDKSKKEPDLGDIAGTDSIPQDASIVLGIQRAAEPYSESRRVVRMMKNREGEVGSMTINYRFEPVDFSEVVESHIASEPVLGEGWTV